MTIGSPVLKFPAQGMKTKFALSILAGLTAFTVVAQDSTNPPPPQVATTNLMKIPNWGTDIMHYFVREGFTNNGVTSNATGVVDFREQHQGKSDQKHFNLTLRKLAPTNTYTLLSLKEDETNYTEVVSFTTDSRGSALLRYREIQNHNGKGPGNLPPQAQGKGPHHQSLPEGIADLTELTELVIVNTNAEAVLTADLTSPDRLHYLIKRKLTNDPVGALLQIQGTATRTHFRLQVLNLLPTNSYWLAINETVVQENSTDSKGRLRINSLTAPLSSPLDIESVQLLDSNTNILISTKLPLP
jgi:hypothetical protein